MVKRQSDWRLVDRRRFLAALAEHGDALKGVQAIGRPLQEAYDLRAADKSFAGSWTRAVAMAWDRVEARLLERLLATPEPDAKDAPGLARLLDTKLVMALVQQRLEPVRTSGRAARVQRPANAEVTRLRAEIRALGGSLPDDWQPE
ncbi:hypothetical protein GCM10007973_30730 [Polymorphobacter multimanifer]|uniref:Uncharacterized protein n=1 Tax=Polymorphobacter multimanifer TaxID=1070431 RepID=A0A841L9U7_9SPHN|nr:hypothetical protein [Polymorphobacter multimanifer]MBB6226615.1 hypothetical protein [Polymorphobacter multimanifer]GGI92369.1 hypothetical protein GCM10007973_30730 [Polymorphobacter multimanifer]